MAAFILCIKFYSNSDILNQAAQFGPQCLGLGDTGKANSSPSWGLLLRLYTTKTHTQIHWILMASAYQHTLWRLAHHGILCFPWPQTCYVILHSARHKYVCVNVSIWATASSKTAALHRAGFVLIVTRPKVSQGSRGPGLPNDSPNLCRIEGCVERLPRQLAVLVSLSTSNKRMKTYRTHTYNTSPAMRHSLQPHFPSISMRFTRWVWF